MLVATQVDFDLSKKSLKEGFQSLTKPTSFRVSLVQVRLTNTIGLSAQVFTPISGIYIKLIQNEQNW